MSINFIFSKDSDETRNLHTKSNNREIMTGNFRKDLEESMRGSEFNFDSVTSLY